MLLLNPYDPVFVKVLGQGSGWISLECRAGNGRAVISCSAAFPPFCLLFYTLQFVWCGAPVAMCDIDEEGVCKRLQFKKILGDLYSFQIRGQFDHYSVPLEDKEELKEFLEDEGTLLRLDSGYPHDRDDVLDGLVTEYPKSPYPLIYVDAQVHRRHVVLAFYKSIQSFFLNEFDAEAHPGYEFLWEADLDWLDFGSLKELWKGLEDFDPELWF